VQIKPKQNQMKPSKKAAFLCFSLAESGLFKGLRAKKLKN
jgi:hypothetical protein